MTFSDAELFWNLACIISDIHPDSKPARTLRRECCLRNMTRPWTIFRDDLGSFLARHLEVSIIDVLPLILHVGKPLHSHLTGS